MAERRAPYHEGKYHKMAIVAHWKRRAPSKQKGKAKAEGAPRAEAKAKMQPGTKHKSGSSHVARLRTVACRLHEIVNILLRVWQCTTILWSTGTKSMPMLATQQETKASGNKVQAQRKVDVEAGTKHAEAQGMSTSQTIRGGMKVKVSANVLQILAVDQTKETFTMIFVLTFKYIDPSLRDFHGKVTYLNDDGQVLVQDCAIDYVTDGYNAFEVVKLREWEHDEFKAEKTVPIQKLLHVADPDWDGHFSLQYSLGNVVGEPQTLLHERKLLRSSEGLVQEKIKFQGEFSERLELLNMPFDRQVLRARIYAELPLTRMQFFPETVQAGKVLGGNSNSQQAVPAEWQVVDREPKYNGGTLMKPTASLMVQIPDLSSIRSMFDIVIHVERRPEFYVWNIIFVLFALSLTVLFSYKIPVTDVSDRAQICLVLILTKTSYKMQMSEWFPVKPYFTFLDKYIMMSFVMQMVIAAQQLLTAHFLWTGFEQVFAWFVFLAWILWHVHFLYCYCSDSGVCRRTSWEEVYLQNEINGNFQHP